MWGRDKNQMRNRKKKKNMRDMFLLFHPVYERNMEDNMVQKRYRRKKIFTDINGKIIFL